MEELDNPLGALTFTWAAVGSTPAVQRIQIPSKATLKQLVLRMAGTYDQSVGNEAQATEGCSVLIKEIRLTCNGRKVRGISGAALYELNRLLFRGALTRTDPAVGVANGKAFAVNLIHNMIFGDFDDPDAVNATLLDLLNYNNTWLEIEMDTFSAYVSGNTQANMTATITVATKELPGVRRVPPLHAELQLVQVVDMTVTTVGTKIPLNITKTSIRGLLLRVGTLAATPRVTAVTALTQLGVGGKYKSGPTVTPKVKLPTGHYQAVVGADRSGIALTAGWVWLDFASDRNYRGCLVGDAFADLYLEIDKTGTPNTTMEVYQYCIQK